MGYSAKWVLDNLGITRDMLRYYEKERLIPIHESRNPANNYRDYDQKDI
ncbi:MAG: MerR family DNA-binding transcriptional regulator, partial [Clostridia bacterium]|nr:MerR family DNA-binding transcriptional regulator [Clostridia bacterium]